MKTADQVDRSQDINRWPPSGMWWRLAVAVVVGLVTLVGMMYPFDFGPARSGSWLSMHERSILIVLGHIALFVPCGLAEGWLVRHVFSGASWTLALVVLDVALLSLVGETAQLWVTSRDSCIVDLVANTLGGITGTWIAMALPPRAVSA